LPIYTYECQTCSDSLERRQSFSEDPLTIHENCGGSLRRIIHPAGIVFKGSGFYNTDYKNATPSTKPAGDSTDSAGDAKKAETTAGDNGTGSSAPAGDAAGSGSNGNSTPAATKSESNKSESSGSSAPAASTP
jgi:putative FmdB family regulatory protein